MGFLTLFYYEINFQHRFAVVDVPLPSLSLPLSVGFAIFQFKPHFAPSSFEHVFTLVFLWSCLSHSTFVSFRSGI